MARVTMHLGLAALAGTLMLCSANSGSAQSTNGTAGAATSPSSSTQAPASTSNASAARALRHAARRRQRALAQQQQQSGQTSPSTATQVGPTATQRRRDAQILAAQKAQSAETARENDAVTQKSVRDQQKQQAEPRIQDAPGPGSQPLPGDPAVQPVQPVDPPRIQDAPGPAQTLPKAPPQP